MSKPIPPLRERKRTVVQWEVSEVAASLFVERGYEATTVDDVAAAVGMSKRSVFRYFPAKEDLALGKFDTLAAAMLDVLSARPLDEPVWTSLRAMLEMLVPHIDSADKNSVSAPMQRVIFETPHLLAGYLERQHRVQETVVATMRERALAAGRPYAADDPSLGVLVAAAFGCLTAAQRTWLDGDDEGGFEGVLGRGLAALEGVG
ncbi:TetR/AcrR family transcriptional regulator [Streptomyces sp. NPDC048290]|uniref:TetR/AcrR family transcriptional regulator n=1 Tax=Streptomyces sp. NPDC048290 TaxID=3155811 RepID=UPI00341F9280